MNAAINYVEQEKLDELEQQYRSRGHDVRRDYRSPSGRQYDMVALKGDERAVFEVKALPALAGQGRELRELRRRLPKELQGLANRVGIDAVSDLDISAIQARTGSLDLTGDGVVAVTLGDGGSEVEEESQDDFPFRFHVLLTADLRLAEVYELRPDVSGFAD